MVREPPPPSSPRKTATNGGSRHETPRVTRTPGLAKTPATATATPSATSRTATGKSVPTTVSHHRTKSSVTAPASQTQPLRDQLREQQQQQQQPDSSALNDYQLGDCLGKGAFGSVYKALNWGTGETVAVKQVKVADLPKTDLRAITQEIDLLKNLDHPNIVKYHGFVKSSESLYIILEYCENGSLHSICKKFGKFPENLVALYMSQALHGLLYLHEQGVIHRDIKGANILTTKEGLVKLADFGVATKATGLHESSVVGTPYWMAPEVIELSGATTASDIWSLGCTVIELLDGKPPYHKLQPMPALFRIVNDDHPPLPESASPVVKDFLMQCFQKSPNLRVSAKKLLKHVWIVNAKRTDSKLPVKLTKYDEAVKTVQEWNEALRSPNIGTLRKDLVAQTGSPRPSNRVDFRARHNSTVPSLGKASIDAANQRAAPEKYRSPEAAENDNWDDDFASSINLTALQLPHLRPVDNFGGRLSADKLKAYAANEAQEASESWKANFSNDVTLKNSLPAGADPLETVRASSPSKSAKEPKLQSIQQQKIFSPQSIKAKSEHSREFPKASHETLSRRPTTKRSSSIYRESAVEDYSDVVANVDDMTFHMKFLSFVKSNENFSPKFSHVSDLKTTPQLAKSKKSASVPAEEDSRISAMKSSLEIQKYADQTEDEDFSDIFRRDDNNSSEKGSEEDINDMLNSKLSYNNSWILNDDDDDEDVDPFAGLEEDLDKMDIEIKVARDKHARTVSELEGYISDLQIEQSEDSLAYISDRIMEIVFENPLMKSVVISSHGLIPIVEILEASQNRDLVLCLLKIVNSIIADSVEDHENFCLLGGIPAVTKFTNRKWPSDIRLEAAAFVRQSCQASTLTLQMFISSRGLSVLVEFLEEDYDAERDLVLIGVNGVWSVFELQGPTPKNDFCRIFARSQALYPLSLVLNRVLDEEGELAELVEGRIANIFFIFSQAESYVKESVADRMVLKTVLKDLRRMSPTHQTTMLKFIKNLSMLGSTLDSLQNSNAIEILTDLLSSNMNSPHFRDMSSQILNTLFNMCRLNTTRQEDAALSGVIPLLQKITKTDRPLKEFALPILCDMAHSGKVGRKVLWQNKGLSFYISLLGDHYWRVTAIDAIFVWLQEETAKVEEHLLDGAFGRAIVNCYMDPRHPDAFESMLEPLIRLLRLSPPVAATLAQPELFYRTVQKLHNKKALTRGNILRIIRIICDANEDQVGLLQRYGLYDLIVSLAEEDPAILVRNIAMELLKSVEEKIRFSPNDEHPRYRALRRTSSSTLGQPGFYNSSQPSTPQKTFLSSQVAGSYFDMHLDLKGLPSSSSPATKNGSMQFRPTSRDSSSKMSAEALDGPLLALVSKSRLPRTNVQRTSRSSLNPGRRDESAHSTSSQSSTANCSSTPRPANNAITPKKRRPTAGIN